MSFLTVVGHVNIDVIFDIKQIPSFGSEEIRAIDRRLGGTGANIARFAALLGTPVRLISRISNNFPEELLIPLRNDHIELSLETSSEEGPVCYIADAKDNQIAYMYQGPMSKPGRDYEIDSKYCHFATSNPEWILNLIRKSTSIKVFDPGQEIKYRWKQDKLIEATRIADLVILNEAEFNYLASFTRIDSEKTIVTLGGRGAIYRDEMIPTEHLPYASSLGAGDVFRAGLYSALYRGMEIRKAIACANRVTSFYLKNGMRTSNQFDWKKEC
ncbi:MAG: PfkB family carbohydrate kinase [Thermoplasmatales archaeon]|nr:PfkB family carbohydrate kinase [Thermoplasmatales archaeon]